MNLPAQVFLGTVAYGLLVPGFAWLMGWLYTFFQPLDKVIHLDRVREFYVAGAAFGAIVATVIVGTMMRNFPL